MPKYDANSLIRFTYTFVVMCNLLFSLVIAQDEPNLMDLNYHQVFTPSCEQFITTFVQSESFRSCKPISFYISTSTQFSKIAESNTPEIDEILTASCSVEDANCSESLQNLRKQMSSKQTCGSELASGSTVADKIFQALANHNLYQRIGCLKDLDSGEFCLTKTFKTGMGSSLYRLPFGDQFSASNSSDTQVCSLCSRKVMDIYSRFGAQWLNKLKSTYDAARDWFSENCGETYARIMSADTSYATVRLSVTKWLWVMIFILAFK